MDIRGIVLEASAGGNVLIGGAVLCVADGDAVALGRLKAELAPAAMGADLGSGRRIDALADSASKVAEVLAGPELSLHIPLRSEVLLQVEAEAVAVEER